MKKKIIRVTSALFPNAFTSFAYRKLTRPQNRQLKKNEKMSMDSAKKSRMNFKNSEIQLYEWENEKDPILLVHGWEGQAGNFSSIIERLLEENFSVITFDGPSHGLSSKNKGTSLFEFAELVGVIIEKYQIKNIISHSFGGVATMYSLSSNPNLKIDKYLLLTTPNKFLDRIEVVSEHVGISKSVKEKLILRLEDELKMDLTKISVANLSKDVKVNSALIIHDQYDQVLSINESIAVNNVWSASTLEAIEGTGHFKILRATIVHDRIITFLED